MNSNPRRVVVRCKPRMKPYIPGIFAVIGLACFVWFALPPMNTSNAPSNPAMTTHLIGCDNDTVFFQFRSPRLTQWHFDVTTIPVHRAGGFGFANINLGKTTPLIPDYALVLMPRWFLLCMTLLLPVAWLMERMSRTVALRLVATKRECTYCGYSLNSYTEVCPSCQTILPLCSHG